MVRGISMMEKEQNIKMVNRNGKNRNYSKLQMRKGKDDRSAPYSHGARESQGWRYCSRRVPLFAHLIWTIRWWRWWFGLARGGPLYDRALWLLTFWIAHALAIKTQGRVWTGALGARISSPPFPLWMAQIWHWSRDSRESLASFPPLPREESSIEGRILERAFSSLSSLWALTQFGPSHRLADFGFFLKTFKNKLFFFSFTSLTDPYLVHIRISKGTPEVYFTILII